MANRINNNEQLMVGADPEFVVRDPITGNTNDYSVFENFSNSFGALGTDAGPCAELRPSPGSPRRVTENISALLQQALKGRYKEKLLLAGGGSAWEATIGGHIHFNVHWEGESEKARLLKLLDRYIGIPMKALPGGTRTANCYGCLGDYETKPYGFEYRTPPSWLTDPRLTESVLSVGYLIVDKWLKDSSFELPNTEAFLESDLGFLIPSDGPFLKHWDSQVKSYAEYIFGNFNLASEDMRERWLSPALIEFKRGNTMVDLLGNFRGRVAAALAETRRIEAEVAATRLAQAEAHRLAAARLEAARRQATQVPPPAPNVSEEQRIWGIFGNLPRFVAPTLKQYANSYSSKVFRHRWTMNTGSSGELLQLSNNLRIGCLKVLEHDGYGTIYNGHHIRNDRGRAIRLDSNIVYLSSDLKHLVKRSRSLPFKIKFVNISGPQGISPRTVWFSTGSGRTIDSILQLFWYSNCKRRVPQGFYGLEDRIRQ